MEDRRTYISSAHILHILLLRRCFHHNTNHSSRFRCFCTSRFLNFISQTKIKISWDMWDMEDRRTYICSVHILHILLLRRCFHHNTNHSSRCRCFCTSRFLNLYFLDQIKNKVGYVGYGGQANIRTCECWCVQFALRIPYPTYPTLLKKALDKINQCCNRLVQKSANVQL